MASCGIVAIWVLRVVLMLLIVSLWLCDVGTFGLWVFVTFVVLGVWVILSVDGWWVGVVCELWLLILVGGWV